MGISHLPICRVNDVNGCLTLVYGMSTKTFSQFFRFASSISGNLYNNVELYVLTICLVTHERENTGPLWQMSWEKYTNNRSLHILLETEGKWEYANLSSFVVESNLGTMASVC